MDLKKTRNPNLFKILIVNKIEYSDTIINIFKLNVVIF